MAWFSAWMVLVLGAAYALHHHWLSSLDSSHTSLLLGFYGMNAGLGLLIGMLIIYLSFTKPELTGFTFMGGSLLKFGVFFVVFFPGLSEVEVVRKEQFIVFFIPYALSMIIEVWYLIRFLNRRH
jgi:hypothetical protein